MKPGAGNDGPASLGAAESPVVRLGPLGLIVGIAALVELASASVPGVHAFDEEDGLTTVAVASVSLLGGLVALLVGARRTAAVCGLVVAAASACSSIVPAHVAGWMGAIGEGALFSAVLAYAREVARSREAGVGAFFGVSFGFSAGWTLATAADLHVLAWPLLAVGCLFLLRPSRPAEAAPRDAPAMPLRDAFVLALLALPVWLLKQSGAPAAWVATGSPAEFLGMARVGEMAALVLTGAGAIAFVVLAREGRRVPPWQVLGAASMLAGLLGSAGLLEGAWSRAGAFACVGGQQLGIEVVSAIGLVLVCDAGGPRTRTIRLAAWLLAVRLVTPRLAALTGDVLDTHREQFAFDCILCVVMGALTFVPRFVRNTRRRMDAARAMVTEDDPRFGAAQTSDQVAGATCADCDRRIVLESSGVRCSRCGVALHQQDCARHHEALAHPPVTPDFYR
jgi:hypothetical protein